MSVLKLIAKIAQWQPLIDALGEASQRCKNPVPQPSLDEGIGLIHHFNDVVQERELEPLVAELGDAMRSWWSNRRG